MSNTQQIKSHSVHAPVPAKTSSLERVQLGFEYNKTLQDIKREVKARTI